MSGIAMRFTSILFVFNVYYPVAIEAYSGSLDGFSGLPIRNSLRRDDPTDPEDHSAFTGFAGLGDSFFAGIGGSAYDKDNKCARGDSGYPNLLNQDGRKGDPAGLSNSSLVQAQLPNIL